MEEFMLRGMAGLMLLLMVAVTAHTNVLIQRVQCLEWDVNPHCAGMNRDVERLLTGLDRTAWYMDDHFNTFKKIR